MTKEIITQQELKKKLHYNPDTGIFTRISINKFNSNISVGDHVGCVHRSGCLVTEINKKQYQLSIENKQDAITARKEANIKYNFHKNHGV